MNTHTTESNGLVIEYAVVGKAYPATWWEPASYREIELRGVFVTVKSGELINLLEVVPPGAGLEQLESWAEGEAEQADEDYEDSVRAEAYDRRRDEAMDARAMGEV